MRSHTSCSAGLSFVCTNWGNRTPWRQRLQLNCASKLFPNAARHEVANDQNRQCQTLDGTGAVALRNDGGPEIVGGVPAVDGVMLPICEKFGDVDGRTTPGTGDVKLPGIGGGVMLPIDGKFGGGGDVKLPGISGGATIALCPLGQLTFGAYSCTRISITPTTSITSRTVCNISLIDMTAPLFMCVRDHSDYLNATVPCILVSPSSFAAPTFDDSSCDSTVYIIETIQIT